MNHIFLFSLIIGFFNIDLITDVQINQNVKSSKVVETLPVFPGCENQKDSIQKINCTERGLLEYWYNHVKYPDSIQGAPLEGIVVVQFIVTEEGRVEQAKISRGLGKLYDDEAIRVIHSMNEMNKRWIPGTRNGQPVDMSYSFPARFSYPKNQQEIEFRQQKTAPNPPVEKRQKRRWKQRRQKRKSKS